MDARILEYFLRVVEVGSINRAAGELRLSQPSLSRWLTVLEHEVGTPLLIRTRRGVHPTDAGQQLVDRAQPILRQLNLLRDEIGGGAVSQVALGMPFALRRTVTVPFVAQLSRETPNLSLRVHEGMSHTIRSLMEEGLVDIGVVASSESSPDSFEVSPLFSERLFLVGPADAGLDVQSAVPVARLAELALILPDRPNVIRAQVEGAIHAAGGTYRGAIDAETLSLCLDLTRQGLGHTVMPESALSGQIGKDSGLCAAPIAGTDLTWSICANRARGHSVAVRRAAAGLRDFVEAKSGTEA